MVGLCVILLMVAYARKNGHLSLVWINRGTSDRVMVSLCVAYPNILLMGDSCLVSPLQALSI